MPSEQEVEEALMCLEGNGGCLATGAHSYSDCKRMGRIACASVRALRAENAPTAISQAADRHRSFAQ